MKIYMVHLLIQLDKSKQLQFIQNTLPFFIQTLKKNKGKIKVNLQRERKLSWIFKSF